MCMKNNVFVLLCILCISASTFVIVPPVVDAQIRVLNECNDGADNDGDKTIDREGGTLSNGLKVPADKDCQSANAVCEKTGATGPCPGIVPSPGSGGTQTPPACPPGQICLGIKNPLKVDSIQGALKLFMDAVLRIAIPFIVIFFIWSGFNMIAARGNKEKLGDAKKMFWYTILGTLLILGAWTITNILIGTINTVTG